MPNEPEIHAVGEDESRSLRLSKQPDNTYRIIIWWGRGDKALATLNFDAERWDQLIVSASELKVGGA